MPVRRQVTLLLSCLVPSVLSSAGKASNMGQEHEDHREEGGMGNIEQHERMYGESMGYRTAQYNTSERSSPHDPTPGSWHPIPVPVLELVPALSVSRGAGYQYVHT